MHIYVCRDLENEKKESEVPPDTHVSFSDDGHIHVLGCAYLPNSILKSLKP